MTRPQFLSRWVWFLLAVVAVIVAAHFFGLADILSLRTLARHREALLGFVGQHFVAAAVIYVAVYAIAVAFSLPGALILTLSGGFLFGALMGAALAVTGATLGATALFLAATHVFGKDALSRFGKRADRLAHNLRSNAWSYLLVLRLVPLFPFFMVNLVSAFVGVPTRVFVLTTLFGIMPGAFVYALSGAGLGSVLDGGGEPSLETVMTPEILGALIGLAALVLIAVPIRKRFERKEFTNE